MGGGNEEPRETRIALKASCQWFYKERIGNWIYIDLYAVDIHQGHPPLKKVIHLILDTLQDQLKDWRKTALILTSIFFLASAIWFIGKVRVI